MLKFCTNLSFLWTDRPLRARIEAAAAAGFRGVEYASPYGEDLGALASLLRERGLEQVLFNLPMGDFDAGERGFAVDPSRIAEFRRGVGEARAAAAALGCRRINCLSGKIPAGLAPEAARETFAENLRFAAAAFAGDGLTLLIEPLNAIDTPGYYLETPRAAFELVRELALPNLFVQYDAYHAQRGEGNIIATLRAHRALVRHVQVADAPGRNEPDTGELAYDRILRELDALGYGGWVALEYTPSTTPEASFAWIERYGFTRAAPVEPRTPTTVAPG
jgi:hydroxypyruvate isomerase